MLSVKEIREKTTWYVHERTILKRPLVRIADYVAWVFQFLPLTPNMISWLWIILQIGASFILLKGTYWSFLIGTIIFQWLYILDYVDGKISRIRKTPSINAQLIDRIGHNITNPIFLICFSLGLVVRYESWVGLFIGMAVVMLMLLEKSNRINLLWYPNLKERKKIDRIFNDTDTPSKLKLNIQEFVGIQYPLGFIFFSVLIGFPEMVLPVYFLLYLVFLIVKIVQQTMRIYNYEKNKV